MRNLADIPAGSFLAPAEQDAQMAAQREFTGTERYQVHQVEDGTYHVWDREEDEYLTDARGQEFFENFSDAQDLRMEWAAS